MTPEERVKRLKDFDRWTVTSVEPRGHVAKRRQWVFPVIAGVVTSVLTIAVVLGALNLREYRALHPAVTPSPTSSATPSPTPTEISLTGQTPPSAIFDGDCSKLFSDAEMSEIAGATMSPYLFEDDSVGPLQAMHGFAICNWHGVDTGSIDLTVSYDELDISVDAQTCGKFTSGEGMLNKDLCLVDQVSHGVRLGGVVYWPKEASSRAIAQRLVDAFKAKEYEPGVAPAFPSGTWRTVDCDEIGPIEVDGAEITWRVLGPEGGDSSSLPLTEALGAADDTATSCTAEFDGGNLSIGAQGGIAWRFDEMIPRFSKEENLEAAVVEGFDHAAHYGADGFQTYLLTSGPNYLMVYSYGEVDLPSVAIAAKKVLDETAR